MAVRCSPEQALADLALPVLEERRSVVRKSRAWPRRSLVLLVVQALMAAHIAHWMASGRTMTPLEPSEAMQFSQSSVVNAGLIFFALTIASTLVLGRWFCGWACHVVALQDWSRWLLEKIGLRPRAVNLGLLGTVPWVAFAYMFLAPIVQRLLHGQPAPGTTMELTTERLWETFPSWPVALATFLVCGSVIVYLLGSKGFCNYACPYGAIFGITDQLAPMRILVSDACDGCGHCTAACTSNVKVHQEVRDFGAVVDPACMKHLDCVSVCPKDALRVGFGAPAIAIRGRAGARAPASNGLGSTLLDLGLLAAFFAGSYAVLLDFDLELELIPNVARLLLALTVLSVAVAAIFRGKARRVREYSRAEEALLGGCFLLAMYAFRGFHGAVPLLLALGLSAILAYLGVQGLRLLYRREISLQRMSLRAAGRLTAAGTLFAAALLPIVGFWGYAGWSRFELRRSYLGGLRHAAVGEIGPATEAMRRAVALDAAYRDAQVRLGSLLCDAGRLPEGIEQFRAAVGRHPERPQARALLAAALFLNGDLGEARSEMEHAVRLAPSSADLHRRLAGLCEAMGDGEAAKRAAAEADRLASPPGRKP